MALANGCGPDNAAKGGGANGTVHYSNGSGGGDTSRHPQALNDDPGADPILKFAA
jgi:hypothetical protein